MAFDPETAGVASAPAFDPETAGTPAPRRRALDIMGGDTKLAKEREQLKTAKGREELAKDPAARGAVGVLADIALEGGGGALGQAAGTPLAPATFGASIPLLGGAGAALGNYLAQKRAIASGEQDSVEKGRILSAALTGAIPGGSALRGLKPLAKVALAQGAAGAAAKTLQTEVDEGRLPTGKEMALATLLPATGGVLAHEAQFLNPRVALAAKAAEAGKSVKAKTLDAAIDAGLVIPPSHGGGGAVGKQLEGIAGKAALDQQVSLKNQAAVNRLVKAELGVPKDQDVTMSVLRGIRKEEGAPYAEVEKLASEAQKRVKEIEKRFSAADPHELAIQKADPATRAELAPLEVRAGANLEALKEARFARDTHFDNYRSSGNPEELSKAIEARKLAESLDDQLEASVTAAGKPELAKRLRAARTRIAKSYSAEEALNLGDANFDASVFGKQLDRGAPLSGNLKLIAEFQQAFPASVREGAKIPTPGVSKLNLPFGLAAAGGTYGATQNVPLALASVLAPAAASSGSRALLLSKPYQELFSRLPENAAKMTPDQLALAIRQLSQSAGKVDPETKLDFKLPALPLAQ